MTTIEEAIINRVTSVVSDIQKEYEDILERDTEWLRQRKHVLDEHVLQTNENWLSWVRGNIAACKDILDSI